MSIVRFLFGSFPALLLPCLPAAEAAPAYRRAALLADGPFASPASPVMSGLVLRGFYGGSAAPEVSLCDAATGAAAWLRIGESLGRWKLLEADAIAGRAVVESAGRRLELRLSVEVSRAAVALSSALTHSGLPVGGGEGAVFRDRMRLGMDALRARRPELFPAPGAPFPRERELALNEAVSAVVREARAFAQALPAARVDERMSDVARARYLRPVGAP